MTYLTVSEQKLILLMLEKENIGVSFSRQKIYKSNDFYNAVRILRKNNLIINCCLVCTKKIEENSNVCKKCKTRSKEKNYRLNLNGEIVAVLIKNIERV